MTLDQQSLVNGNYMQIFPDFGVMMSPLTCPISYVLDHGKKETRFGEKRQNLTGRQSKCQEVSNIKSEA